jgi:hypothetical protein
MERAAVSRFALAALKSNKRNWKQKYVCAYLSAADCTGKRQSAVTTVTPLGPPARVTTNSLKSLKKKSNIKYGRKESFTENINVACEQGSQMQTKHHLGVVRIVTVVGVVRVVL